MGNTLDMNMLHVALHAHNIEDIFIQDFQDNLE